jgi:2-dehydro-3-deoxyphosphogluconate aldolase / (4S)-4-hydroxy-2-oxoglutarate aldolase
MLPTELLGIIGRRHFIAEIRTETAKQAIGVVEALARGGIVVFEISLAIPGAEEILRHYASSTELIIGAGGVLDSRQCAEAAGAGARFISSPIVAPELVPVCVEHHVVPILGALTPTEIISAQRAGAEMVKVMPVSAMGGSLYVRSLFRQFTYLSIMVSGGINLENLSEYLALPVRAVALSSTLTPRTLVERGDWSSMAAIARRFVDFAAAWEASAGSALAYTPEQGRPALPDTMMAPSQSYPPPHISQPGVARSNPGLPPPPSLPPPEQSNPSFPRPAGPRQGDEWIR